MGHEDTITVDLTPGPDGDPLDAVLYREGDDGGVTAAGLADPDGAATSAPVPTYSVPVPHVGRGRAG